MPYNQLNKGGNDMPQFVTIHRAPGLKSDELVQNAPHVLGAKIAVFKQILDSAQKAAKP